MTEHSNGRVQDILIAFKTNGLIRLNADANYELEIIDINCGVFSLWKDGAQNIIWIGTDGQGVYALTKGEFAFHNISLDELPVSSPLISPVASPPE